MKSKLSFSVILIAGLLLVKLSVNQAYCQTPPTKLVKQQTVNYTCPMHPEVMMDKPGKCPKCGIKLVEKKIKDGGMKKDSTTMKHVNKKMMHDSTSMKKGQMKM